MYTQHKKPVKLRVWGGWEAMRQIWNFMKRKWIEADGDGGVSERVENI